MVRRQEQIGAADRQIMDVDPDFQGGFNTRVAYKGFDLSLIGSFQIGGILVSTLNGAIKLPQSDDRAQREH